MPGRLRASSPRVTLRELSESDRAAFVAYQLDPRYRALYDFGSSSERPSRLFDAFLAWQREVPRIHHQLGIFDPRSGQLLGCGGLRQRDDGSAVLGLELAPAEWGRYRLALDAAIALLDLGFDELGHAVIVGDTASGNTRVAKLALRLGAQPVAERDGPAWMKVRGWREVDWSITREAWQRSRREGQNAAPIRMRDRPPAK